MLKDAIVSLLSRKEINYRHPKTVYAFGMCSHVKDILEGFKVMYDSGKKKAKMEVYIFESDEEREEQYKYLEEEYSWLSVETGLSVNLDDAVEFILEDELLASPEEYGLKINPLNTYLEEVESAAKVKNDILEKRKFAIKYKNPIFVLNSCEAIGWLEFQKVMEIMESKCCYVVLTGTNGIRHLRSYSYITFPEKCKRWEMLAEGKGWCFARGKGNTL